MDIKKVKNTKKKTILNEKPAIYRNKKLWKIEDIYF